MKNVRLQVKKFDRFRCELCNFFKLGQIMLLRCQGSSINDVTVIRGEGGQGFCATVLRLQKKKYLTMGVEGSNNIQNCVTSFMNDPLSANEYIKKSVHVLKKRVEHHFVKIFNRERSNEFIFACPSKSTNALLPLYFNRIASSDFRNMPRSHP